MARHEFKVRYSEDIVRSGVRRYYGDLMRRELTWRFRFAVALVAGALAYGLFHPQPLWLEGLTAAILVLVPTLLFAGYLVHLRQALAKLHAMGSPIATLVLTDDTLEVRSGGSRIGIPWSHFAAVLESPSFWVLRLQRGSLTVPTDGVDGAILNFIRSSVGTSRGVV